ncbi:MAG: pyruvate kinase [Candidatus Gastranaerophilales bacterium]|nr:pyruvate kinase [Candidatus Gastranaerophilales bacterium]
MIKKEEFIKTKIVATIGPASDSEEVIKELILAGTTMFRLNSSHETPEVHLHRLQTIRKISKELGRFIPVVLDLQGPKIRVGNLDNPIELKVNQELIIKPQMEQKGENIIPVDYEGIVKDVKSGDRLLLDDGRLEFRVTGTEPDYAKAVVVNGGILKSRKGLNIPGSTLSISAITKRDVDYIKFSVDNEVDYIALSFVRSKDDVIKAKNILEVFGKNIPIISKIEKPQAIDNLDSIITVSEGIMVARGDLGIEISPEKVPLVQKKIIKAANAQKKVVIVATQMLESMVEQPMPTRAEASDVANAIIDGTDAVMLSEETTIGKYPVKAVEMMAQIAKNVENSDVISRNYYPAEMRQINNPDAQAICSAIMKMIEKIDIKAILAFTASGYTPSLLSKGKPSVPIYALCENEAACRQMNLYRDVFPVLFDCKIEMNRETVKLINNLLVKTLGYKSNDKIIITGSIPELARGKTTNFIRLHEIPGV